MEMSGPRWRTFPKRGAFTLPEVLLALTLLTLAALAVGNAMQSSLALLTRARSVEQPPIGWSIARGDVLELEGREEVEDGGTIDLPDGSRVRWEAEVEETEIPDLFAVELQIEVDDQETNEVLFLYRAERSNAVDRGPLMDDARREIQDRLEEVNR